MILRPICIENLIYVWLDHIYYFALAKWFVRGQSIFPAQRSPDSGKVRRLGKCPDFDQVIVAFTSRKQAHTGQRG